MASNFDFVPQAWPDVRENALRAESYGISDPRSSEFYARRTVETLVIRIFDLERLALPYKGDLNARMGESDFKAVVAGDVLDKMHAIRRFGNAAVHENRTIRPPEAMRLLSQLHDVLRWAAYVYSTTPEDATSAAAFDESLVPSPQTVGNPQPLSNAELNQLLTTFEAKDAQIAAAKATNEALQAELEQERQKVARAQAAKAHPAATFDFDEASTRSLFIDADLVEAGWDPDAANVREYPVTGMPNETGAGYIDYVLWGDDGLPLAIIEAKRSRTDPLGAGQQQAKLYADCLEQMTGRRPIIFNTNGYQHRIWDDAAGYPPRPISGFLTKDELELMVQRRRRAPLSTVLIDRDIVERHYQHRAIRAVGEAFEGKNRGALLVMATGSGKTRTAIALVDQLMRAGWVKRVLFLADRVALVNQAASAFKAHLPKVATVNLVTEKDAEGRVFVSTYPTMMGMINDVRAGQRRFGPGHFDLIIIDEAHRSIYQKYGAIFRWFDSLLVGLTATPKDEIDRNTYGMFNLESGVPTDAYSLDEAVAEGYLVPPVAVSVPLRFPRDGIHYDQLSEEERDEWDSLDWGDDVQPPNDIDPEALNRWIFNSDTVDKVLATLMNHGHKVAGGDVLGKSIIFAKSNEHAEFIRERFDLAYPEFGGHFARVVTYRTEYAQSLIDDFSTTQKAPHIAISVDMLDTGIDVPDVVNLVFFKRIHSVSKFWQMVGRGTRLRKDLFGPGLDKENFYIFDFCQNLEYFRQPGAGSVGSLQKSLSQRLFEARVELIARIDADGVAHPEPGENDDATTSVVSLRRDTADQLCDVVAGMNLDNFLVRPEREWVQRYAAAEAWREVSATEAGELADHLAGLPSAVRDSDEDAKRFDLLILKVQLALLESDAALVEKTRRRIQDIASSLLSLSTIPVIAAQEALLLQISEDEWWQDVTVPMLELVRRRVRALVKLIERSTRNPVYTNFADEVGEMSVVDLPGVNVGTDYERFKAKSRAYLREHEDHVAIQKVRRNKQLTDTDLRSLERMLLESGAGTAEDVARAREEAQGLGLFIRSLVGLDREAATEAFSEFLADTRFSASQLRMIQLLVEHLTANGVVEAGQLYEPPFTDLSYSGPEGLFGEVEVDRLFGILHSVRTHATAEGAVA